MAEEEKEQARRKERKRKANLETFALVDRVAHSFPPRKPADVMSLSEAEDGELEDGVPLCELCGDEICRCQQEVASGFPGPWVEKEGPKELESDMEEDNEQDD